MTIEQQRWTIVPTVQPRPGWTFKLRNGFTPGRAWDRAQDAEKAAKREARRQKS